MKPVFNILVIHDKMYASMHKTIQTYFVPRIGDRIALFHYPFPVVSDVLPLHEGMEVETTNMKQMVTSIGLTWEQFVENYTALIFVS